MTDIYTVSQKEGTKLLFMSSPNIDHFYILPLLHSAGNLQ